MSFKEWKLKQYRRKFILFQVHCQWNEMVNEKGCAVQLIIGLIIKCVYNTFICKCYLIHFILSTDY
jgi:Na+/pantothenate symporter